MSNVKYLAFTGLFSALNLIIASLNRLLPPIPGGLSIGHITTDAILITCVFLTAVTITKKVGVASLIGLITGLLMLTIGAQYIAIMTWFLRGLVFDVVLFGFIHRPNPCMKHFAPPAFFSFLIQTIFGKSLTILIAGGQSLWFFFLKSLFIPLALIGAIVSIAGAYLALKIVTIVAKSWDIS